MYEPKVINFMEYFKQLCINEENKEIKESVMNKIKHLYTIRNPEMLVQEFKKIFNITDKIEISKVSVGGNYDPYTKKITYSTNNSLIHELIHYIQNRHEIKIDKYKFPVLDDDEKLLQYILQPLELNNWALSLADDAQEYNSFDEFLKTGKKCENFGTAGRVERLNHIKYLLQSNVKYSNRTKDHQKKFIKLTKQYFNIIKTLENNVDNYLMEMKDAVYVNII